MHLATISEMHAQLLAMLCNTKANVPSQIRPPPPPTAPLKKRKKNTGVLVIRLL